MHFWMELAATPTAAGMLPQAREGLTEGAAERVEVELVGPLVVRVGAQLGLLVGTTQRASSGDDSMYGSKHKHSLAPPPIPRSLHSFPVL